MISKVPYHLIGGTPDVWVENLLDSWGIFKGITDLLITRRLAHKADLWGLAEPCLRTTWQGRWSKQGKLLTNAKSMGCQFPTLPKKNNGLLSCRSKLILLRKSFTWPRSILVWQPRCREQRHKTTIGHSSFCDEPCKFANFRGLGHFDVAHITHRNCVPGKTGTCRLHQCVRSPPWVPCTANSDCKPGSVAVENPVQNSGNWARKAGANSQAVFIQNEALLSYHVLPSFQLIAGDKHQNRLVHIGCLGRSPPIS